MSLVTHYGIEVESLTPLSLGADLNATVYKGESAEKSYFVKVKKGGQYDVSEIIVNLLHNSGIPSIIPPIQQSIQYNDDCKLIVYPFIEGQNGFSVNLNDEHWIILGKTLKQIHEMDVPAFIENHLRRETFSSK